MTWVVKLKLFFVFLLLNLLLLLECFDRTCRWVVRICVFCLFSLLLLTGFYLESEESYFYRYHPLFLVASSPVVREVPYLASIVDFPSISAKAVFAIDPVHDKVFVDQNSRISYPPASTTKLMTALVALDLYGLDETLITPAECTDIEGTRLGLLADESMQVKDLLYATLISSANDAACVLAQGKVAMADFVSLMNAKAGEIGLETTNFTNPIGLDDAYGDHHSSAYDLYLLGENALANEFIRDVVKIKEHVLKTEIVERKIYTTNHLLWAIPETVGIKTGTTLAAGEVLIYKYADEKREIVIVVMGSEERFLDTRQILDWILASYVW